MEDRYLREYLEVLQKEIDWCEKNKRDGDKNEEGFIQGLHQAKLIASTLRLSPGTPAPRNTPLTNTKE